MAAMRAIVVTSRGSQSFEEARHKSLEFFRDICRALPQILDLYILEETTTVQELRSKVAEKFRARANVKNPKVIDMLVYKGREELGNYVTQSKQRHHILSEWVEEDPKGTPKPKYMAHPPGIMLRDDTSPFLKKFYESNYDPQS